MLYFSDKMVKTVARACIFLLLISLFLLTIHAFVPHSIHDAADLPNCTICALGNHWAMAIPAVVALAAFIVFFERRSLPKPHHASANTDRSFPLLC